MFQMDDYTEKVLVESVIEETSLAVSFLEIHHELNEFGDSIHFHSIVYGEP